MWLHIPSISSPSAQESEVLTSGSSSQSQEPELFVTLNSTLSRRPVSWRGWKTRPWIVLLSGTISRPLMADHGAARFIASLPDIHAPRSVSQGDAVVQMIRGTSGLTLPASLQRSDQNTLFSKTSTIIYLLDSRKSFPSWSGWVSALRQECLRRKKLEPTTKGRGFSRWPTATAMDSASSGAAGYEKTATHNPGVTLTDAVLRFTHTHTAAAGRLRERAT